MTGICAHDGCFRSGTWIDEDDGRGYCGEHVVFVAPVSDDEARQKRRDFADEYARDAAREGWER
jgi:hypothetical protein